jgi:hypothetical protein
MKSASAARLGRCGPEGALGFARPLPRPARGFSELPRARPWTRPACPSRCPPPTKPCAGCPAFARIAGRCGRHAPAGSGAVRVPVRQPGRARPVQRPGLHGPGRGGLHGPGAAHGAPEIIERDAECVTPHDPARCFRVESGNRKLRAQLAEYAARGMDVGSRTSPPSWVCRLPGLCSGPRGQVTKGAAAGLCGPQAAASALFEVPYPFPGAADPTRPLGAARAPRGGPADLSTALRAATWNASRPRLPPAGASGLCGPDPCGPGHPRVSRPGARAGTAADSTPTACSRRACSRACGVEAPRAVAPRGELM